MGFRSVYRVLQEVFPQVDSRVLRAVAIEHSKDADVAVEVVLVEVIPFLSTQSTSPGSSDGDGSVQNLSNDSTRLDNSVSAPSFVNDGREQGCGDNANVEVNSSEKCEESSVVVLNLPSNVTSAALNYENATNDDLDRVSENSEGKGSVSLGKFDESSIEATGFHQNSHVTLTTFKRHCSGGSMNDLLESVWKDLDQLEHCNSSLAVHGERKQEQLRRDGDTLEMENSVVQLTPPPVKKCLPNAPESSHELIVMPDMPVIDFEKPEPNGASEQLLIDGDTLGMENSVVQLTPPPVQNCAPNAPESNHGSIVMPDTPATNFEKPEPNGASDAAFKEDTTTSEMADLEGDFTMNTVVTRSGQIYSLDLIDDIIEDARSNKKIMLSAGESVISLMREVELQERAAEQAKEEAARGGFDILAKVEELKQQLRLAKEANDMHAGEVYGEKSILATEVKELQSRLLSLSDERDKSLAILDEMRQTLEERLSAAEKEMEAAEQEKVEKDESARNLLAHQTRIMETVVQESKILKQEAEENSKLREFLMDRGRVVDMLQGEIHVKCQDVKRLKEKFDERIPLIKFLSASQTACFLSSSSSSLKSTEPDQTHELVESSENHKNTTSKTPSIDGDLSPGEERKRDDPFSSGDERERGESNELGDEGWEFFRKERARDDRKVKAIVDDDGWELFDNHDYLV